MSVQRKSKKLLTASTMLVIIALVTIVSAYAVTIATITSSEVSVGNAVGTVQYAAVSEEPGSWSTSFQVATLGDPMYARLNFNAGGYSGNVTISWQLQNETAVDVWSNVGVAESTNVWLSGAQQYVYVSATGVIAGNHNWADTIETAGNYQIVVTITSYE